MAESDARTQVGKFLLWGTDVADDVMHKILQVIPEAQPWDLVEIPNEDCPSLEQLGLRVSSY